MTDRRLHANIGIDRGDDFSLDISVEMEPGTTVALLGPNGAGKSTTVAAIAGITPIDRGTITLGPQTLDDPLDETFVLPEDRGIGIVFQDYLLFGHLSAAENVAFGPRAQGRSRRDAAAAAAQWLETLELSDVADRRPAALSGGQAQRVALARALATEPNMLLLDEPLAALDVSTRNDLRRTLLDHLRTFAGPRLLITHEPTDAFLLADRVYVIEDGRVTQEGTTEQIRRRPATPYVAALTGTNLLTGTNRGGTITLDGITSTLRTSDRRDGAVQVVVPPRAISLHPERPQGSPRNTWQSTIDWIEPLGETTRIRLADPLPVMVDITPAAADALALGPGTPVWAAVKATEVAVTPLASPPEPT